FFVEEVVRTLAERGRLAGARGTYRLVGAADDVAIPASVQAVLAARIDALGERDKAVLQVAAVIGREFTEPVLARVAGLPAAELAAALHALVQGEFVYQETVFPDAGYAFRHPLTHEVAYRGQLAAMRLLNFGWRRGLPADEAAAIFAEGMALAECTGDRRA